MNESTDSFLEMHGVSAESAALVAGLDAIEKAMAPTVQDTIEPVLTPLETLRTCFYEVKSQRDQLLNAAKWLAQCQDAANESSSAFAWHFKDLEHANARLREAIAEVEGRLS